MSEPEYEYDRHTGDPFILPAFSPETLDKHLAGDHVGVVVTPGHEVAMHDLMHTSRTTHGHDKRETVVWWGPCGHSIAVSTQLWNSSRSDVEDSVARIAQTHLSVCAGGGVTSVPTDQGNDDEPSAEASPAG